MRADFHVFAAKVADGLVSDLKTCPEDMLPSTLRRSKRSRDDARIAMNRDAAEGNAEKVGLVHPQAQVASEHMGSAAWKQTLKDGTLAAIAGGAGWGIGHTLTQVIGEHIARNVAAGAPPPSWLKAVTPVSTGIMLFGALAASRQRQLMKERREAAEAAARK